MFDRKFAGLAKTEKLQGSKIRLTDNSTMTK